MPLVFPSCHGLDSGPWSEVFIPWFLQCNLFRCEHDIGRYILGHNTDSVQWNTSTNTQDSPPQAFVLRLPEAPASNFSKVNRRHRCVYGTGACLAVVDRLSNFYDCLRTLFFEALLPRDVYSSLGSTCRPEALKVRPQAAQRGGPSASYPSLCARSVLAGATDPIQAAVWLAVCASNE